MLATARLLTSFIFHFSLEILFFFGKEVGGGGALTVLAACDGIVVGQGPQTEMGEPGLHV